MQFRSEMAEELLVTVFQRLVCEPHIRRTMIWQLTLFQNLRYALFSRAGKLTGLITKRDVVRLLMAHFAHTPMGALARDGKGVDHEWNVDW